MQDIRLAGPVLLSPESQKVKITLKTRERLKEEIDSTRIAFQSLLDSIPEEALSLPSDNPAWNNREVLYHIAAIPRHIILEALMISKQNRILGLLPRLIQKGLFDWLNARLTRLGARGMTRARLADEYEKTCKAVLHGLDSVPDGDFGKSVHYPLVDPLLAGDVTIEYLFGYIKRHFDSHSAQIEKSARAGAH